MACEAVPQQVWMYIPRQPSFFPEQGIAFLGAQGDIWHARKDIMLAFSGANLATGIAPLIKKGFKIE